MDFKERPLIFVDIETSGLDPMYHDILEIGAIKTDQAFNELGQYESKIRMEHAMRAQAEALAINGYTEEAWEGAPSLHDVMIDFAQFSKDGILAAWNVAFEHGFLREAFRNGHTFDLMGYHRIDVPSIAWFRLPQLKKMSMDAISEILEMPAEPKPHRAITGAQRALDILKSLAHWQTVEKDVVKKWIDA